MNTTVIVLISIAVIGVISLLVARNIKDKKDLENRLNQDYPKPPNDEGDIEIDEKTK
jgi:hypothetical protein